MEQFTFYELKQKFRGKMVCSCGCAIHLDRETNTAGDVIADAQRVVKFLKRHEKCPEKKVYIMHFKDGNSYWKFARVA